jgi:hypothetical protein
MSRYGPDDAVNYEVARSFRKESSGYISRSAGGSISCPPYVIADCAARRVPPNSLQLPDGYDQEVLDQIMDITGFVDRDVRISRRQADELAQIGAQLLKLHSQRKVQPPLGYYEEQSVAHLVQVVSTRNR